jgi:hypothetical protein
MPRRVYICGFCSNPITYSKADAEPLKFTRKRRNLKEQTNLFLGFALNAQRRNTEK